MGKFCTSCGAVLREGAKFCAKCGANISPVSEGADVIPAFRISPSTIGR
ncbi:MAG: zinc ribbon domain-containing protein [Tissierellia bacterium]|jgi:uncharacterized membrane protein YvbJ|nr:zinc ribbon domain-containing protein [Tissierellia bacterium]